MFKLKLKLKINTDITSVTNRFRMFQNVLLTRMFKWKISDRHYINHKSFQNVLECSSWKSVTVIASVTNYSRMFQNVLVEIQVENQWQTLHQSQIVPECSSWNSSWSSSWKCAQSIQSCANIFTNLFSFSNYLKKIFFISYCFPNQIIT